MALHRTVFIVEVLSDNEFMDQKELDFIARDIIHGDSSGAVKCSSHRPVSKKRMAKLLEAQGSDPAFLLGEGWEDKEGA